MVDEGIGLGSGAHRRGVRRDDEAWQRGLEIEEEPCGIQILSVWRDECRRGDSPVAVVRSHSKQDWPVGRVHLSPLEYCIKRTVDLVLAGLFLIVCTPLMGLISILVRLDSPGPALFCQWRIGAHLQPFRMYKFRSMTAAAGAMCDGGWTLPNGDAALVKRIDDARVTRVGRWLRRTSLDELPQLFNVLRGDMSLVGPRPELPALLGEYQPVHLRRFEVPQGMTGWWQVNGRSNKTTREKILDDLYYIEHYSLLLDIKILLLTPWVVLGGEGAF
jgi:lipopolysaccharide/colanic/teichoic acid biosynthesis glycosyltransferase